MDDMQAEFFALLVFRDGDVFDVAYAAEVVDTVVFVCVLVICYGGYVKSGEGGLEKTRKEGKEGKEGKRKKGKEGKRKKGKGEGEDLF